MQYYATIRIENANLSSRIDAAVAVHSFLKFEMQKVPVMLIIGDKDIEGGTVSVRRRTEGDLGAKSVPELIEYLKELAA